MAGARERLVVVNTPSGPEGPGGNFAPASLCCPGTAAESYRRWRSSHRDGEAVWSPDGAGPAEEYHGPHVVMPPGREPVEWRPVRDALDAARVVAHTCECRAVMYELCGWGGAYFIRRTVHGSQGDQVAESPRVRLAVAEEWWSRLLRGRGSVRP